MKQREHETLGISRCLRNSHRPRQQRKAAKKGSTDMPQQCGKLPKHTIEATYVLMFFAIAVERRMSEKNPAFSVDIEHNGPGHDV
jgi:hypothetical protein